MINSHTPPPQAQATKRPCRVQHVRVRCVFKFSVPTPIGKIGSEVGGTKPSHHNKFLENAFKAEKTYPKLSDSSKGNQTNFSVQLAVVRTTTCSTSSLLPSPEILPPDLASIILLSHILKLFYSIKNFPISKNNYFIVFKILNYEQYGQVQTNPS